MSLQIRLPLNGNLNNYGLFIPTVTNHGETSNDNGKIGKCYSYVSSNSNYTTISTPSFSGKSPISICMWFKMTASSTYSPVFEFGKNATNGICVRHSSQVIRLEYGDGTNNYDKSTGVTTTLNTWYHICVTYDGTTLTLYRNGVNVYSIAGPNTGLGSNNNQLQLSKFWAGYASQDLNDVRLYDHCLSVKEIKEIYRSLVIHYKFSEYNILKSTCQNILWNQAIRSITLATNMASLDNTLPSERKYVIKNTQTSSNRFIYTAGTTIPIDHKAAVYIKFKSNFTQRPYLRYAKASGSYTSLYPSNYIADEWCEIKGIISGFLPGGASGILPNSNGYVANEYFSIPKEGGFMIFDLTAMNDFFGMFPNLNYAYDTGTTMSFVEPIPESSGYERFGTINTGSLTLSTNSARYDKCTVFDGSTNISGPILPNGVIQSCSFWIYIGSSVPVQQIVFVDTESKLAFGFWRQNMIVACVSSTQGVFSYNQIKLNAWNHITINRPIGSTNPTLYLNGVLQTSISSDYWSTADSEFSIGDRLSKSGYPFSGKISDFRMYAAPLSQDDVNDIITQASIDNHNNLYGFEYKESTTLKIKL